MNQGELQKLSKKFKWRLVDESVSSCTTGDKVSEKFYFGILTQMIADFSRETKRFHGDMVYEILGIEQAAKECPAQDEEMILRIVGIREDGVDHPEWVEVNAEDPNYYTSVFKVTVERREVYRNTEMVSRLYRAEG